MRADIEKTQILPAQGAQDTEDDGAVEDDEHRREAYKVYEWSNETDALTDKVRA